MTNKEYKFIRGMVLATRKKIEPWDWYYETENGKEIEYGKFGGYVRRAGKREVYNLFKASMYNRKEDKKECKKCGYIGDYFDFIY